MVKESYFSHLILAIAATTSGLHRSFARTFMVDGDEDEEEDAVARRCIESSGAVEQWKRKYHRDIRGGVLIASVPRGTS